MPKLTSRPPLYKQSGKYAVIYVNGKRVFLGLYGSPESHVAYARFLAEWQANPTFYLAKEERNITVRELAAAFLDHAKATQDKAGYGHYRTIVVDFLLKLYGDDTPADSFKPSFLKLVREDMIQSRRFNRNTINKYARRLASLFEWGVENELVLETTWRALKTVKFLPVGYPGTFEGKGREDVHDAVIKATLPYTPPTIAAMVKLQRLTGMRPSEVFGMRVGNVDRTRGNGLWYYVPKHHKTERFIGAKSIPLGKHEQNVLEPFLIGKKPTEAVFSPRQAMEERNAERRANRKTKITPSQAARDKARAAKPPKYAELYDKHTYRQAIAHAIKKANRHLLDGEKIPFWTPYQLRHAAGTAAENEGTLDDAQALLGHRTPDTTRRYAHNQQAKAESLARNRRNPFDTDGLANEQAAG